MPYSTRAPKELLHHLSALILRRPCVSADPVGMLAGERGSRLLDRRPPHYRCPAVPGHKASARAILMVLGPSVLPSVINCLLLVPRYCVLLSGLTQRHSSAASPVAHPASALAWNPTAELPGARIRSRRLHRGYCSPLHCWVLLMAAPDLRAPGPVVSPVAVLHQPWLRNSTTAPSCELQLRVLLPGSSSLPGPVVSLGYERNHIHAATQCLLSPS